MASARSGKHRHQLCIRCAAFPSQVRAFLLLLLLRVAFCVLRRVLRPKGSWLRVFKVLRVLRIVTAPLRMLFGSGEKQHGVRCVARASSYRTWTRRILRRSDRVAWHSAFFASYSIDGIHFPRFPI